jgi:hypothetical protein
LHAWAVGRQVAAGMRREAEALAAAAGVARAPSVRDPRVLAIRAYRRLKDRLKGVAMKKAMARLDDGREIEVREMTWAEAKRVRDEGETLPMEWPLLQQFAGREAELDGLGVSEVATLASAVYRLTFAPLSGSSPAAVTPPVGDVMVAVGGAIPLARAATVDVGVDLAAVEP